MDTFDVSGNALENSFANEGLDEELDIDDLNSEGCFFEAFCLADSMFVISLGMPKISCDESIMALMRQGGGYLPSLVINDHYRRFKNRKIFKWLRTLFGFSG